MKQIPLLATVTPGEELTIGPDVYVVQVAKLTIDAEYVLLLEYKGPAGE